MFFETINLDAKFLKITWNLSVLTIIKLTFSKDKMRYQVQLILNIDHKTISQNYYRRKGWKKAKTWEETGRGEEGELGNGNWTDD